MQELVARIRFPMRRLSSTGNDDAWPQPFVFSRDGGGQMHRKRNRANDPFGMIDEPNKLSHRGLAHQIKNVFQFRMPMFFLAALHKLHPALEMIDHLLI
jgi:hypothetical protein